jgi:hypothetical protein
MIKKQTNGFGKSDSRCKRFISSFDIFRTPDSLLAERTVTGATRKLCFSNPISVSIVAIFIFSALIFY